MAPDLYLAFQTAKCQYTVKVFLQDTNKMNKLIFQNALCEVVFRLEFLNWNIWHTWWLDWEIYKLKNFITSQTSDISSSFLPFWALHLVLTWIAYRCFGCWTEEFWACCEVCSETGIIFTFIIQLDYLVQITVCKYCTLGLQILVAGMTPWISRQKSDC